MASNNIDLKNIEATNFKPEAIYNLLKELSPKGDKYVCYPSVAYCIPGFLIVIRIQNSWENYHNKSEYSNCIIIFDESLRCIAQSKNVIYQSAKCESYEKMYVDILDVKVGTSEFQVKVKMGNGANDSLITIYRAITS